MSLAKPEHWPFILPYVKNVLVIWSLQGPFYTDLDKLLLRNNVGSSVILTKDSVSKNNQKEIKDLISLDNHCKVSQLKCNQLSQSIQIRIVEMRSNLNYLPKFFLAN